MLQFLRKRQKFFFLFITVMIIFSFLFFGTFSTIMQQDKSIDKVVGRSITGSAIMQKDLEVMKRLISTSEKFPNLLSDQFFMKEFMQTGLVHVLGDRHFEEIKEDISARKQKAKYFRPYSHTQFPQWSAENIWSRFSPALNLHLHMLQQSEEEATRESFALLCALYQDQAMLPSETLRRILLYQMQGAGVMPDINLEQGNLALFGFDTLEDWFGPRFVDILAECLCNAAAFAEKEGYAVSLEEARTDMLANVYRALKQFNNKKEVDSKEAVSFCHRQIQMLGLDENSAAEGWKKLLSVRRYFDEQAAALFIDPASFEPFIRFAQEGAKVELYQLPQEFSLPDLFSLLEFQIYLEAIGGKSKALTALPKHTLSPDEVEKKFPELVSQVFEIEYKEASKQHLAQKIGLKETWDWETQAKNWDGLSKKCPSLST